MLTVYHAISFRSMICLGNWAPSYLAEVWSDSLTMQLAWGGALVMLISGLGRLLGGVLLFKFSPISIAQVTIFILSLFFLSLFVAIKPGLVLSLLILAAWFSTFNYGAIFHLVSRATTTESLASLIAFMNLIAIVGTILLTLMFGWGKDMTGSFSWAFAILASFSLMAFLVGRVPLTKRFIND